MCLRRCIPGALCAAVLAVPPGVLAGQPGPAQPGSGRQATAGLAPVTNNAAPAQGTFGPGTAIGAEQLEGARGGSDAVRSQAQLQGAVEGNSATQVVTGNNVIQSGSFAHMSGLPVVIQNSGANVLIQNATVINLELK